MRRSHWWPPITLVLLAIALPLLLFPDGLRVLALLLLPIIWLGNRVTSGHFIQRTPFDVVVLVMLIMVWISVFATYDLAASLPKISGLLLGVGIMYAVTAFSSSYERFRFTVSGSLIALAAFMGIVLIGTSWGRKVPVLGQIASLFPTLIQGLPGAADGFHPAEVAGTLTWIGFLPASLLIGRRPVKRSLSSIAAWLVLLVLSVATGFILILTQSRSAWMGAAVGLGVLTILVGQVGRRLLAAGILTLPGLMVLGLLVSQSVSGFGEPALASVFAPNIESRVEIWSRAVYGIQDFPLTGMGMGTFRYVVPVLYPLYLVTPDRDIGHAHNEMLQAGVDLGIPGLVSFMALQGLAVWMALKLYQSADSSLLRGTAAGMLAGLVAHVAFGLTDAVALGAKPGAFFWLILGLTAAAWTATAAPKAGTHA